jgi:hypothetical protein
MTIITQIVEAAKEHYGTSDVYPYLVGHMSATLTQKQLTVILDFYTKKGN